MVSPALGLIPSQCLFLSLGFSCRGLSAPNPCRPCFPLGPLQALVTSFWKFPRLAPGHSASHLKRHLLQEAFLDHPPILSLPITLLYYTSFRQPIILRYFSCLFIDSIPCPVCEHRDLIFWLTTVFQSQEQCQGHGGCLGKSLLGIFNNSTLSFNDFKSQRDNALCYMERQLIRIQKPGSWCGLLLTHCAMASTSFKRSAWGLVSRTVH